MRILTPSTEHAAGRHSSAAAGGAGERGMGPWYKDGQCSGSTVAVENVSRGEGDPSRPSLRCGVTRAGGRRRVSTCVLNPPSSRSAVAGDPCWIALLPAPLTRLGFRFLLPHIFLSSDVSRFESPSIGGIGLPLSALSLTRERQRVSGEVTPGPDQPDPSSEYIHLAGVYFLFSRRRQLPPSAYQIPRPPPSYWRPTPDPPGIPKYCM